MKELIPLWDHQRQAYKRAVDTPGGYGLFMEMGTGKSGVAVCTLRQKCYEAKSLLRTLVFCPPVVRVNWKREFKIHSTIPQEKIHLLEKSGAARAKTMLTKGFIEAQPQPGIFITNYEALAMKDLYRLFKAWKPELLIWDESQRLKNYKAKRTKLAIELADLADYNLLLSGTPILNTPMDIWAQFRILDGGQTFDHNFFAFRARYFIDKNSGMPTQKYFPDWQPRTGLAEVFNKKIYAKATRVLKKDCLDLPPLVRKRIHVELSPEQRRVYSDMESSFVAYLEDKACVASLALTKGLRLQQMVSGFIVDDKEQVVPFRTQPRLEALKEILEELVHEHKVIVWSSFRASYEPIHAVCADLGVTAVSLYGGMTDSKRQGALDDFQTKDNVRVIIANQAAGGTGVNLTAASYMVYFSRGFGLEDDLQSESRAHRGGSEVHDKITRVDIVAPNTIDETILDALARKENMASNILRLRKLLGGEDGYPDRAKTVRTGGSVAPGQSYQGAAYLSDSPGKG